MRSASGALSCAATVFSLRASLAVALLLTDPAASICRKEGLLPPQHCRQGWQFSSNHLTSLQRPRTLRFCVCSFAQNADLPLFCPITPCLSGIQLRHSCSWPALPDTGAAWPLPAHWTWCKPLPNPAYSHQYLLPWNLTSSWRDCSASP